VRTLADGLTMGQHPYQIANSLARDVDGIGRRRAKVVARHRLIWVHAEGQLDNLERLGVEEVGVAVEWAITPDNKVCPKCAAMQGLVLKTRQAHGLIPLHPECRCAWIPSFDPPSSPEEVEAAVQEGGLDMDELPAAPKKKGFLGGIFNVAERTADQPRDTLGRFAHVGADKKFTPNDERRSVRAAMWLLDHGEEMAEVKHDPINLKGGRDYLKEASKHDVVVLHSIYQGKLEAEGQIKELLESGMAPASVSDQHSPEAWRVRLAKSGAKHIFVFSDQSHSLNSRHLGDIPGYTKKVVSWDMTVYSRRAKAAPVANADPYRDERGRFSRALEATTRARIASSNTNAILTPDMPARLEELRERGDVAGSYNNHTSLAARHRALAYDHEEDARNSGMNTEGRRSHLAASRLHHIAANLHEEAAARLYQIPQTPDFRGSMSNETDRLVYADYLEDHGFAEAAHHLRVYSS
jgi:SPP1 gp7 family putative phage head morphogenesis protein